MKSNLQKENFVHEATTDEVSSEDDSLGSYVLNVEESALGKKWVLAKNNERLVQGMSQLYMLPEIISRILVSRGIGFENVERFMNPSIKDQLPDPNSLKDMDKAAQSIADAIINKQSVAVFGDYDVDGATSSALLKRFFNALGQKLRIYIPDRIDEGYGPNAEAILKLKEEGADLVITVDCGITSFEALGAGTNAGLDIVVLDHHRADVQIPNVHAAVNPNRIDDESGQGHMAAVGVVFLTIVAINRILRDQGFYNTGEVSEPRILQWLDLVALGTVCDVVPLTGVNRAFVSQGLKVMSLRQNKGLNALAEVASISEAPNTFHAGFVFGPRINAGGRVGEAGLGAWLLSTEDEMEAKTIAQQLDKYNNERRDLEKFVLEQAIEIAETEQKDSKILVISGESWHPGVIGIVASRLKEKYNKPACVISFDENGVGKASARSVSEIDLGASIISARQKGYLVAGGGHKMAAGFTVAREMLSEFTNYVNDHINEQLKGIEYKPQIKLDGVLSVRSLNIMLAEKLNMLAPYGMGNAEPRFALAGVKVIKAKVVGENHISCFLQDTTGGTSVKAIAFRAVDSGLSDILLKSGSAPLNIAGQVTINEWQGQRSVNFQILDAAQIWN